MSELWTTADNYFGEIIVKPDPAYAALTAASKAAGLPDIAVSASEGKQLHLLAKISGAKRILEIGTLGGYSTLWLARALPEDGLLTSLEYDPHHAAVAKANLAAAGVGTRVDIKIGAALEILPTLQGPFDFFFIDANKDGYPDYFRWAVKLSRPGSVIVADNMVRGGKVAHANTGDCAVEGVRQTLALASAEPRVTATVIQTVGERGHDGYMLAVVS